MTPRRVAIATSVYPPDVAGPGEHFAALAAALRSRGWDVTVLVRPSVVDVLREARAGAVLLAHATPRTLGTCLIAKLFMPFPLVTRVGGDFLWERAVGRGAWHGTLRAFHDARAAWAMRDRAFGALWGFFLRQADARIYPAAFLRDVHVRTFGIDPSRTAVIAPAVPGAGEDVRIASAHHAGAGIRIVYAGRFIALKNLGALVKAIAGVRRTNPGLTLSLIGEGPDERFLRALAHTEGVADLVAFKPPMTRAILLEELTLCDLAVLPSLSDVAPNFLLDALATRTPMVATQETGLCEMLGDTATWFDPAHPGALAQAIASAIAPGALMEARRRIDRWHATTRRTWDDVARETEDILARVAA